MWFEYSQGTQLVHLAAAQVSTNQNRVVAVVTFGDPDRDQVLPGVLEGRRKTFCAKDDLICDGKVIVLPAHLSESYRRVSEIPSCRRQWDSNRIFFSGRSCICDHHCPTVFPSVNRGINWWWWSKICALTVETANNRQCLENEKWICYATSSQASARRSSTRSPCLVDQHRRWFVNGFEFREAGRWLNQMIFMAIWSLHKEVPSDPIKHHKDTI